MKRQLYVVLALMLASGVAWSDGYRGYGPNPYGVYGNPANSQQPYGSQGRPAAIPPASNSYGPNGNPAYPYPAHTPYGTGNPYTPYSTPNQYGAGNSPYGIYGKPYGPTPPSPNPNNGNANPASTTTNPYDKEMQQFYDNQGYFRGSYGADQNPAPDPSGLYGNPGYPGPINAPSGVDSPYSPGSSPYEQ